MWVLGVAFVRVLGVAFVLCVPQQIAVSASNIPSPFAFPRIVEVVGTDRVRRLPSARESGAPSAVVGVERRIARRTRA